MTVVCLLQPPQAKKPLQSLTKTQQWLCAPAPHAACTWSGVALGAATPDHASTWAGRAVGLAWVPRACTPVGPGYPQAPWMVASVRRDVEHARSTRDLGRFRPPPHPWRGPRAVICTHGARVEGQQKTGMAGRVTPAPTGQPADGWMEVKAVSPLPRDVWAWSEGLPEAGIPLGPWSVPARTGNRSITGGKAPGRWAWSRPRL